jgi:hypothetical protein
MGFSTIKKNRRGFQQILLAALTIFLLWSATAETVYGPEWTRTCEDGVCHVSIGEPNLLVGAQYLPFDQAVTIRWENREGLINGFVVYFPEGTITVEPSVTIDKTTVLMSDTAKTAELGSIRATPIIKGTKAYEYALQIDNIPSEKSLDNVLFRLRLEGIKEEDLKLDETNSRLQILDKYTLGFEDLKETGYNIRFLDKTTLEITNTAGKSSLLLDPSVSLSGAKVLGDTYVSKASPATNYGTSTVSLAGQGTSYSSASIYRAFIKFNLTGSVVYNASNVATVSSLSTYYRYHLDGSSETSNYRLYSVEDQPWVETTPTWNVQPTLNTYLDVSPTQTGLLDHAHAWITFTGTELDSYITAWIRNSSYKNISFGIIGDESTYPVSIYHYLEIHPKEVGSGYEILAFDYSIVTTTTTTTLATTTSSGATTTTTTTTTTTAATTSTSLMLPTVPMSNMSVGYTSTLFGVQKQTFFVFVSWLAVSASLMLFGAKNAGQGLLISAALSWYLWAIGWFIGTFSILWVLLITIVAVIYQLRGDRRPLG